MVSRSVHSFELASSTMGNTPDRALFLAFDMLGYCSRIAFTYTSSPWCMFCIGTGGWHWCTGYCFPRAGMDSGNCSIPKSIYSPSCSRTPPLGGDGGGGSMSSISASTGTSPVSTGCGSMPSKTFMSMVRTILGGVLPLRFMYTIDAFDSGSYPTYTPVTPS